MITKKNRQAYLKRKVRTRKNVHGTAEKPRMSVFRSAKHIYVQVIDDDEKKTLVAASSVEKSVTDEIAGLKKSIIAEKVGQLIAERCKAKSIEKVVFDRNGFIYHGRIAKLADGARAKGLSF
jgi:large subunit ribosomal protein L18